MRNNHASTKKYIFVLNEKSINSSNKFNPVNKSTKHLIVKNKKNNISKYESQNTIENNTKKREDFISSNDNNGVSIITCTNRINYFNNIIENYNKQNYSKKELIIILNSNKLDLNCWKNKTKTLDDVKIFQRDESVTMGKCLNYAIEKSKYNIIAKFDDDDYYGKEYLTQAIDSLNRTAADVVGKSTSYVFFENKKILAIRNFGRENRYVPRIEGPTLVFRKKIFDKVKFKNKNLGEDVQFCKDCCRNHIRIFSTDKSNFIYIRHSRKSNHTWAIDDDYYLKLCTIVGEVDNYRSYAKS